MSAFRIVTVTRDANRFGAELPWPVFVVIDYRAQCPKCRKWPSGVGRSKKQARKAMVQIRRGGCGCS